MRNQFVIDIERQDLGPAKLVELRPASGTISYFDSILFPQGTRVDVPRNRLRNYSVAGARCYWLHEGHWCVGRVTGELGDRYRVEPSSGGEHFLPTGDAYVRWWRPIADPTDALVLRLFESAKLCARRRSFVRAVFAQRAACRGIESLTSSAVRVMRHQVEVVRRVLEDPVQRYLLADEVGLGKTIEAGLVIRQRLLDEPDTKVVIIAPSDLLSQWRSELSLKFRIDEFRSEPVFVAHEDLVSGESIRGPGGRFILVVDEAHRLTRRGNSSQVRAYAAVQAIARACDGLLLLSATPLLESESAYLGMLHLLDPDIHRLEDLDSFRAKVRARQQLARTYALLRPETPAFLVLDQLQSLVSLLPHDPVVERLSSAVTDAIRDGSGSAQGLAKLRLHVSETYRLHKRLVRTRRTSVARELGLPVRRLRVVQVQRPDWPAISEWLESTRDLLSESPAPDAAAARVFAELMVAAVAGSAPLGSAIADRLKSGESGQPRVSADEGRLHRDFLAQLPATQEGLKEITNTLFELPEATKVVVFASREDFARSVAEYFRHEFGDASVACTAQGGSTSVEDAVKRFNSDADCWLLIAHASAEEGLNLQVASVIVHLDLPFAPNRLEQRIGRLDRIGGPVEVVSIVLRADNEEANAWFKCLEAFGMFEESISALQYGVDRLMPALARDLLTQGLSSLGRSAERVRDMMGKEVKSVVEQDALDAMELGVESATDSRFEAVDELDLGADEHGRACRNWISADHGVLQFKRLTHANVSRVERFDLGDADHLPAVDLVQLLTLFSGVVGRWGSFSRDVARVSEVDLFRLGNRFLDAVSTFTRQDDRGHSFAVWRQVDSMRGVPERILFRFDYVVEADVEAAFADEVGSSRQAMTAVRRIADRLFPPTAQTVVYQPDVGEVAEFSDLVLPKDQDRGIWNISSQDFSLLSEIIGADAWESTCRLARSRSEEILRARISADNLIAEARTRLEELADAELAQLELRAQDAEGRDLTAYGRERTMVRDKWERLRRTVRQPRIVPDSAGLAILSGSAAPWA